MKLTASSLRQDIYRVLDQILETGVPVDIERKGRLLRIAPVDPPKKLTKLKKRRYLKGDPEEIVHLDWSSEWRP
ncbi:MAG: type II toxin-antitoxin system Phd/YefM family antitoxin [Planctomycetota bacterium]